MQNYRISPGFLVALLVCVCMGTLPIVNAPATEEVQSADEAKSSTEKVTLSVTGMT